MVERMREGGEGKVNEGVKIFKRLKARACFH